MRILIALLLVTLGGGCLPDGGQAQAPPASAAISDATDGSEVVTPDATEAREEASDDAQRRADRAWYREQVRSGACLEPAPEFLEVLAAGLREPLDVELRGATRSRVHDGRYYVAVNLLRQDGSRESSTTTYVADAITEAVTTIGAVSSSAQRYTTFPDASDLEGAVLNDDATGVEPWPSVFLDPDLVLAQEWCSLPADHVLMQDGF